eukprot:52140_1
MEWLTASFFLDANKENEDKHLEQTEKQTPFKPRFNDRNTDSDCETESDLISEDLETSHEETLKNQKESQRSKYVVCGYYNSIKSKSKYTISMDIISLTVSYYNVHIQTIHAVPTLTAHDNNYNDPSFTLNVKPYHTIFDIKQRIRLRVTHPFMLMHGHLPLPECDLSSEVTLFDCNIKDGDVVQYKSQSSSCDASHGQDEEDEDVIPHRLIPHNVHHNYEHIIGYKPKINLSTIRAEAKLCGGTVKNGVIHYCQCCYDQYKQKERIDYNPWDCWYC